MGFPDQKKKKSWPVPLKYMCQFTTVQFSYFALFFITSITGNNLNHAQQNSYSISDLLGTVTTQ